MEVWTLARAGARRFYEARGCAAFAEGSFVVAGHREPAVGYALDISDAAAARPLGGGRDAVADPLDLLDRRRVGERVAVEEGRGDLLPHHPALRPGALEGVADVVEAEQDHGGDRDSPAGRAPP